MRLHLVWFFLSHSSTLPVCLGFHSGKGKDSQGTGYVSPHRETYQHHLFLSVPTPITDLELVSLATSCNHANLYRKRC